MFCFVIYVAPSTVYTTVTGVYGRNPEVIIFAFVFSSIPTPTHSTASIFQPNYIENVWFF